MNKKSMFVLAALIMFLGCQSKPKDAQQIPMDTFVKMYVSALREDSLMKRYQKPESFPDPALDLIFKKYDFASQDFKLTHYVLTGTPTKKIELDSLMKLAIEVETMKCLH
jgi:hypothetical protein